MSLNNLKKRLEYRGGRQNDRMIEDKARSLNKALLYSYQSATAILEDGREFRCLINPNKLTMDLDDKMLSIPFEDICLNKERPENTTTSQGKEPIGVKCGSVIGWKENGTYWIVYSQYLQEIAYFRGLMRQCEAEPLEIGGKRHYYYLKGPDEKGAEWLKTKNLIFNELNYTVEMYISNTIEANEFFHRFTKIKLPIKKPNGGFDFRPYEVQAVDDISTEGLLAVYLKEDFYNEWEEEPSEEEEKTEQTEEASTFSMRRAIASAAQILGEDQVYPYQTKAYSIEGLSNGHWLLSNNRAKILEQDTASVKIKITTGRSGDIDLIYRVEGMEDIVQHITILSL